MIVPHQRVQTNTSPSCQDSIRVSPTTRFAWWLMACLFAVLPPSQAQEAVRNGLASEAATVARNGRTQSSLYNFKVRDLRVLLTPSLNLEWNDNVNAQKGNSEDDFIIRPALGITANYPLTAQNVLNLNVSFGYQNYLKHRSLSTWYLQSGSELAFDILIKDFSINLHERPSYTQSASQEPAMAGSGSYGTFQNAAGLSVTWNLNDVTASVGYDHQNVASISQQFQSQDHASELFNAQVSLRVHPKVSAGIETTASFTAYDQMILNDNANYSAGLFANWRPGAYMQIKPRAGYTISQFQHTSSSVQTSGQNSWYANLNISHQATEAISYTLVAGREVRTGIQSDIIEDWYVRPGVQWKIIKDLSLNTSFSYEHGNQGVGNVTGNLMEIYDWSGLTLNASYPVMKKLTAALNYRLTLRSSDNASRAYTQNMVGILLTYQP